MAGIEGFELRTARTTIRHWRPSDADVLFDIRRRPDVATWLGDPTPWTDLDQARERIAAWRDEATPTVPSTCAIVPDQVGRPVGSVTLVALPEPGQHGIGMADAPWLGVFEPLEDEVQVGWYLHPDHGGHGWATEAARVMLAHGLANGVPRIWACMWPHNVPSAALCRRLGMDDLGVHVDPWYGTVEDPDSHFFLARSCPTDDTRRR